MTEEAPTPEPEAPAEKRIDPMYYVGVILALVALFLCAVIGKTLADLDAPEVVIGVGVAWLVALTVALFVHNHPKDPQ